MTDNPSGTPKEQEEKKYLCPRCLKWNYEGAHTCNTTRDSGIEAMLDDYDTAVAEYKPAPIFAARSAIVEAFGKLEEKVTKMEQIFDAYDRHAVKLRDEISRLTKLGNSYYHQALRDSEEKERLTADELDEEKKHAKYWEYDSYKVTAELELAEQNIAALAGSVKALESEKQRLQESALNPDEANYVLYLCDADFSPPSSGRVSSEIIIALREDALAKLRRSLSVQPPPRSTMGGE